MNNTKKRIKKLSVADLLLCALFAALIAVGAFIRIPIPVVPFTLQVLFTSLAGMLLGPWMGLVSVLVYIGVGLAGVPIFTSGGGIGYVLHPNFGYLIGFAAGTWFTGWLVYRSRKSPPSLSRLVISCYAGLGIVYLFGAVYFYLISNFYLQNPMGVWPVLLSCVILVAPGNMACCFGGCLLAKRLIPILRKERQSHAI